ncbi:MAG: DMT family transporter [Alphaproteobacteria bacterium]
MKGPVSQARTSGEHTLLVFLGLAWGSAFLFTKLALDTVPPITLTAGRAWIGALMMLAVALALGHPLPRGLRVWIMLLAMGLTGSVLPLSLIAWGQVRIDSGLAAILIGTVPLVTVVLAHFATSDDRLSWPKAAGVALGLGGLLVLIGPSALAGLGDSAWRQLAVFAGACSFAVTILMARAVRAVSPAVSSAVVLGFAGLVASALGLAIEQPWRLSPTTTSLLAMLGLGILSTGAGNHAFYRLSRTAPPSYISLNNYLIPAVALMWGALLLDEPFTLRSAGALALILGGVAVAGIRKRS